MTQFLVVEEDEGGLPLGVRVSGRVIQRGNTIGATSRYVIRFLVVSGHEISNGSLPSSSSSGSAI